MTSQCMREHVLAINLARCEGSLQQSICCKESVHGTSRCRVTDTVRDSENVQCAVACCTLLLSPPKPFACGRRWQLLHQQSRCIEQQQPAVQHTSSVVLKQLLPKHHA